ncbi:MAG: tetratricopeptide repeat protein [Ignavibacteria bacterium]|nr:tetratricopeptide repeat protein [Ignavibacteria bacterium]
MKTKEELIEVLNQQDDKFRTGSDYGGIEQTCRMVLEEIEIVLFAQPEDTVAYLTLRAWALNLITSTLQARGMTDEAILCAEEAFEVAKEAQNRTEEAKALGHKGLAYFHLSDYPRALEFSQKALLIGREIGAKNIMASNLGNIGSIYDYLADYPKALEYMEQSLDVYRELGRKDGVSTNLIHIGGVYLSLSDNSRALEYCKQALSVAEEIGSKDLIANAHGIIGGVYRRIDRPLAIEYLHKALAYFELLGNKSNIATTLSNIGLVYVGMNEYSLGLEYYLKALAINSEIGDKSSIAVTLGNIGIVYSKIDYEGYDAEKAEEYMLQSLVLSEEIGAQEWLMLFSENLATLYEKEKRWEESQMYFKKFHNLDKQLRGEEAVKAAQLMEQRRQATEREKALEVERAEASATKKLLHNTLPPEIADRILSGEKIADYHQNVSVLFADIVGFTQLSSKLPPRELIDILDIVFTRFDTICKKHGLEKIKTIGDAYMAVCGALWPPRSRSAYSTCCTRNVGRFHN